MNQYWRETVCFIYGNFIGAICGTFIGAGAMLWLMVEVYEGKPNDQRVKELRFSLQKLERLKDVHDATLREAATNQGDIRKMVEQLEVLK